MSYDEDILVNGVKITSHDVRVEAQYHPAASFEQAQHQARHALVVRELLRQRCLRSVDTSVSTEEGLQLAIEEMMMREVPVPEVDEGECRRYHAQHASRFRSPDLYEAAHILLAIGPDEADRASEVEREAQGILAELGERPDAFEDMARRRSACPSALQGGNLGQSVRGDMAEEFEAALEGLDPGEVAPEPVRTKHGVHVVKLLARRRGEPMPFEAVRQRILLYLRDAAWRRAVASFIGRLASEADVRGFSFDEPVPQRAAEAARRVRLPVVASGSDASVERSAAPARPSVRPLTVLV